jgi:hypothetical protein
MGEVFGFICALVLRHQLNILRHRSPKRVVLGKIDRLVFCGLYPWSPTVLNSFTLQSQPKMLSGSHCSMDCKRSFAIFCPHQRPNSECTRNGSETLSL